MGKASEADPVSGSHIRLNAAKFPEAATLGETNIDFTYMWSVEDFQDGTDEGQLPHSILWDILSDSSFPTCLCQCIANWLSCLSNIADMNESSNYVAGDWVSLLKSW